ncbi:MAG TPA: DNA ligase D [Thermoanaerobaculia bacterium]|nr:DNA ligase D [Thermoanaerobaculia bacterium]
MALEEYKRKRDFRKTPEPAGKPVARKGKGKGQEAGGLSFVIQKHAATRLHYDFRLEMEGVLRSWAVPKGPSYDPAEKRLAVHVEDHPMEYGTFEGIIPKGQYGGGTVLLWDQGTWYPEGDPVAAYRKGHLKFRLEGEKLHGGWHLVRLGGRRSGNDDEKENWLLFKENDETALPGSTDAITRERPESVTTGLSLEEIAANPERVWQSNRAEKNASFKEKLQATVRASRAAKKAPKPEAAPVKVPGARKGAFPAKLEAQLATLVDEVPRGEEWIHELKFDGYRVLCEVRGGKVRLVTRNGKDWTDRFTPVAKAAGALPVRDALLDGEVVVLEKDGTTSFQALQNALSGQRDDDLVYFAFDLLYLDGHDLRRAELRERKRALADLLAAVPSGPKGRIRYSDHVEGSGEDFYRQACSFSLEGVISKRGDLPYHPGRNKDWLKIKCLKRQELVVAGFTEPEGARVGLGALLLGVYEGDGLVFAGKVGTGFNDRLLRDLRKRLGRLETPDSPFAGPPRDLVRAAARGDVHWVKPELVGEVAFTEWTRDGVLRHPTFQGLREDKSPQEVRRELPQALPPEAGGEDEPAEPARSARTARPAAKTAAKKPAAKKAPAKKPAAKKAPAKEAAPEKPAPAAPAAPAARSGKGAKETEVAGVRLSNPDKVLFPEQGLTKRDLALYYERIAGWILPHIKDRPLTLVRCPEGQGKECFYQKHVSEHVPKSVVRVTITGDPQPYGAVSSVQGLIALVQMGVLELHIWGSHRDDIEKPDYVVFDLDPDEGLDWQRVAEAALLVRQRLTDLGLESFLKTTGGKGLHVVVPLTRRKGQEWDEVKAFTKAVAEDIVAANPGRYTSMLPKARRQGRIFIDYLRNGRGATSICAFSTRARVGAPVSVPLRWDELLDPELRGNTYNVRTLPERLDSLKEDPWEGFHKVRQSITAAIKKAVGMT